MSVEESATAVTDALDAVRGAGRGEEATVGDVLDSLGSSSHAATLLIPAVLCATPLSGIPGFSLTSGLLIFLIAAQMVIDRDHLWLPDWALRRTLPRAGLERWVDRVMPAARFIDRITRPRLTVLIRQPLVILPRALAMLCGMTMPLLELVPTASSILAIAVVIIATGLLARDGLLVSLSLAFVAGTVAAVAMWI